MKRKKEIENKFVKTRELYIFEKLVCLFIYLFFFVNFV